MATFLPLIAVALAILAATAVTSGDDSADGKPFSFATACIAGLFALALMLTAFLWRGFGSDAWYAASGFAIAAVGALGLAASGSRVGLLTALGLAAAVCGLAGWLPGEFRLFGQLGAIAGSALGAWLVSPRLGGAFGLGVAAMAAGDILGRKAFDAPSFGSAGTVFGVAIVASMLVVALAVRNRPRAVGLGIGSGVVILAAFVVGQRYLDIRDAWVLFLAGYALSLAIHWFLPEEDDDPFRSVLAAVLWVLLATVAFGLRKGFGMSLAMLGGLGGFALAGNPRAMLTMGPLAGLVLYRVFRESHVEATRALDIGQHYALVGLLLGSVVPLLPEDWKRAREGWAAALGVLLWTGILLLVPVGIGIVMGPKGIVGFVAGVGISGLSQLLRRGESSLMPMALGTGLAAATTLIFGWLGANAQLTKEEKLQFIWPFAAGALVMVALLMLAGRSVVKKEAVA